MKPPFMKIAIVGAGLAARGAAHFLQELGEITLFDKGDLSPSRLAAGLLHKFVGFHAHKSPYADEALPLSLLLIGTNKTQTGLLRKAESDEQWKSFQKTAALYPDEVEIVSDRTLYIKEAWVVDCPAYLSALPYIKREILSLGELEDYDLVILAGGAESLKLASVPLYPVRGQLLEVTGTPYPTTPITGGVYLIPQKETMIVGATYERGAPQIAEEVLLPKLFSLWPHFTLSEVIAVKGGARASTRDRLPLVEPLNDKTWVFAGLGSKGLLYHAYFGKLLFEKVKNLTRRASSRKIK